MVALLLLLHRWCGILQVQVPKLVGNEVHAPESDLVTRLHLLNVIVNPKDETHLKHDESIRKRPLPGPPTVKNIYSDDIDQRIHVQGMRWVTHKTQELHWFRYVVPYVQYEVDLFCIRILGYRGARM